jgi:hypothetical protein
LKALVLDGVSSPVTRRVYSWYNAEPRPAGFTKATVMAWRVALEARGLAHLSINVRITAVRKLAIEASDNGLLAPELASGIARIKGVRSHGVRVGNWLSLRQAKAILDARTFGRRRDCATGRRPGLFACSGIPAIRQSTLFSELASRGGRGSSNVPARPQRRRSSS